MSQRTIDSGAMASPQTIVCQYFEEPLLGFGGGGLHVNPKSGIARYGPRSFDPARRHPKTVRVGVIGNAETIEKAQAWLEANAEGVSGDEKHPEFPGYQSDCGFFSSLEFDDGWVEQITSSEMTQLLSVKSQKERFESAVALFDQKLRLLAESDQPPEYVVIALPDSLLRRCRVADYHEHDRGIIHRDLRRTLKAIAMKYRIPTQLLRQPTMEGKDDDHPSKIAWNFFTGLYFKVGGIPWSPVGLQPGTCYVGVGFYRALGSKLPTMHTSLVQAFDEHGDGLVLRGHDFEWDSKKERSAAPHLTETQAHDLVEMVLNRYQQEMGQAPRRVVVHKTSRYWPAEQAGFRAALGSRVGRYDLLALEPQSSIRLITESKYPPLRGTRFTIEDLDFLYTTGFIAALGEFHSMHVPSPLRIADHVGQDTARETLLREILILTKMNWNSAQFGGLFPITIKFSQLVGEILREIPPDREPLPQFKFYM